MRIDVASGKLLGLIGFKKRCWGIEVDPAKIQAILDMPPQTSRKSKVSKRKACVHQKIHFKDGCHKGENTPFNKLLRKSKKFECSAASKPLKISIKTFSTLRSQSPRPLLLYISTTEMSIGCVLGQHDDDGRREHAITTIS